jgi:hypothetical protein
MAAMAGEVRGSLGGDFISGGGAPELECGVGISLFHRFQ